MKKILIIQTAFIGDVVLATVLVEKLNDLYPDAAIDFLVRKGNKSLLANNPKLANVLTWEKKKNKHINLLKVVFRVRKERYDLIVNVHRFSSSGLITCFSKAKEKIGFDKNPLSFCYTKKVKHSIGNGKHETLRNLQLISYLGGNDDYKPKLYCSEDNIKRAAEIISTPYVVIAPSSVWFTKQVPQSKWQEVIQTIPKTTSICLIGAGNDVKYCEEICLNSNRENTLNLAGKLSYLESAALMKSADMNYVNDSAPMHFASSVNAPTTAIFCSTIPEFGFGPLADNSTILQTTESLKCRPCGLHGFKKCPEGHFKCALDISIPTASN